MSGRTVGSTPRRGALVAMLAAVAMTLGSTQAEFTTSGPSGYASQCLAVGAAVNAPERTDGGDLPLFRKAVAALGPLTVRRSFDSELPHTFAASAAAGDREAGVRSFVSWKPPKGDHRGVAEGAYDRQISAWAKSVPRTGVYATSFHEPEDNMTGREFVAFQRHLYTVVKAANPTILWGPVYMAYWWDPKAPAHFVGNPADWWPGAAYADFAGLDWYSPDPEPMTASGSFHFWYRSMAPTGVPLLITEYGQYAVAPGERRQPAKEQARAAAIRADAAWIAGHPRIRMWLYWQAVGAQGDWRLRDEASQQAWRQVAEAGCRPE
ncbi:MAG: hypothetical protein JWQ45_509 [Blastococcus sp.]|jgi:hypothetical protein|nr:hypothetical protein [Blastococcus sp.]